MDRDKIKLGWWGVPAVATQLAMIFAAGIFVLPLLGQSMMPASDPTPTLEKVGQLRQSSTPEPGKSYWMAFSNPGRRVKRGDRVDVVIGQFRADKLVVE